jgi:hypothetical protein
VVGDAGKDVAQVGLRIEAVQGRGLDERVGNRGPTTAGVRAGKEVVLAAQRERSDGALGGIVWSFPVGRRAQIGRGAGQRERL